MRVERLKKERLSHELTQTGTNRSIASLSRCGFRPRPELRRTDLGDGDWAIETQLLNAPEFSETGYLAGLEIGFGQYDQIWMGVGQYYVLNVTRMGVDWLDQRNLTVPLYMRVEKHAEEYTFKYRYNENEAWTVMAPRSYTGIPLYVGLIARVFSGGSQPLDLDWGFFRLIR